MAETLGSLCDKLTIIKLKQYHSEDPSRLKSLEEQQVQLISEIEEFISDAVTGILPLNKLTFRSNKVVLGKNNEIEFVKGTIGSVFAQLADINCKLWHEQEKVFEFEKVASFEKDSVIKKLALLNLERNQCIDEIDQTLVKLIKK